MNIQEQKEILDEKILLIQSFYKRAWDALLKEDYKTVIKILHSEMSAELYDLSLLILNDRHPIKKYEELHNLITKVDVKLENYYNVNREEEELINDDSYVKSIFGKRTYKKKR